MSHWQLNRMLFFNCQLDAVMWHFVQNITHAVFLDVLPQVNKKSKFSSDFPNLNENQILVYGELGM